MAKDHYIPQFYLRNFEIPGRTGWVYSYRRGMKPLPKAIRSIACEEDYYDFKTVRHFVKECLVRELRDWINRNLAATREALTVSVCFVERDPLNAKRL
jgi:hypothetical protein